MKSKNNNLIGLLVVTLITILAFTACSDTDNTTVIKPTQIIENNLNTDIISDDETTTEKDVITETDILEAEDYGAKAAMLETDYTLEEMMQYAIEDEYLAYAEYELIINEMDITRPFTNIIEAEATHIGYMEDLYENYGFKLPVVDPSQHIILPETINEAFLAGVEAEIVNIAMYERFLEQELPNDVRSVFEQLKAASESHLLAFQKNVR